VEYFPALRNRAIRPTGNCRPALCDLDTAFFPELFPLPDMLAQQPQQRKINGKKNTRANRKTRAMGSRKILKNWITETGIS
jgi:hypothetical protein